MVIAVDAQILIWGIKRQATPNRQEMIPKAAAFFAKCQADRQPIHIPAQALSEFLCDYDAEKRRQSLAAIARGFIVAPFDGKAAIMAAELQASWEQIKKIMRENDLTRPQIKSDINVVASALAVGADYLYSEDGQMKSLAQGKLIVRTLPPLASPAEPHSGATLQRPMFDDETAS